MTIAQRFILQRWAILRKKGAKQILLLAGSTYGFFGDFWNNSGNN
jgi:hypothetical protein